MRHYVRHERPERTLRWTRMSEASSIRICSQDLPRRATKSDSARCAYEKRARQQRRSVQNLSAGRLPSGEMTFFAPAATMGESSEI